MELAIGGGRVALPLARCGFRVEGIEASAAVAEQLRSTPGAEEIPVLVADMADVEVAGPYALAYLVWNGLFNLTHQERQIECFANVARVLDPGRVVRDRVLRARPGRVHRGGLPTRDQRRSVTFTVAKDDPAAQRLTRQHITLDGEGVSLLPVALRYCWPSELDLMARLAGLRLRDRFANWTRDSVRLRKPQAHLRLRAPAVAALSVSSETLAHGTGMSPDTLRKRLPCLTP